MTFCQKITSDENHENICSRRLGLFLLMYVSRKKAAEYFHKNFSLQTQIEFEFMPLEKGFIHASIHIKLLRFISRARTHT